MGMGRSPLKRKGKRKRNDCGQTDYVLSKTITNEWMHFRCCCCSAFAAGIGEPSIGIHG